MPAGADLAAAIGRIVGDLTPTPDPPDGLGDLTGRDLIDLAAAAQRVAGWATAVQMSVLAEHADRQAHPYPDRDDPAVAMTAQAASLACGVSRYTVENLIATAQALPVRLPVLHAMLLAGELEWGKARLVLDKVLPLSPAATRQVETAIAAQIVALTRPVLAERLDRLVAAADPDALAEQARADRAARRVAFRAAGPGMGTMTLTTGAEDIEAVRTALNALTLAARQAQDDLPPGAHANDAERAWTGPCDPDGRHPSATRADTLVDTLVHAADHPTHFLHPDSAAPDADPDSSSSTGSATSPGRSTPRGRTRADVVVLVPLSVLTGQSDAPALLEGYGPIPAGLAREVAATGTWRCAITDDRDGAPTHATLLGLGQTTHTPHYVPGPRTREYIHLRDGHCVFPGCRRRADLCDLDHRTPWTPPTTPDPGAGPDGGATCECNLHPLCRFHYQVKQAGFTVCTTAHGLEWTTPDGHRYHARPRLLTIDIPRPPLPQPEPPF